MNYIEPKSHLADLFRQAVSQIAPAADLAIELDRPKQTSHGDYACNAAMQLARALKRNPREVAGERVPGSGVMFVGSLGKMYADYGNYRLFPADKFANFKPPQPTIPPSIGHHAEWIKACKEGTPTRSDFADFAGPLTEAVLGRPVPGRCRLDQ